MCSLCDETCENRNLNVMTEDKGEDDDESFFSYGATSDIIFHSLTNFNAKHTRFFLKMT